MPQEERESIGQIRPSGWHTVKYDVVDGTLPVQPVPSDRISADR